MFDREWSLESYILYIYLPADDSKNKTSSPDYFKLMKFYCIMIKSWNVLESHGIERVKYCYSESREKTIQIIMKVSSKSLNYLSVFYGG